MKRADGPSPKQRVCMTPAWRKMPVVLGLLSILMVRQHTRFCWMPRSSVEGECRGEIVWCILYTVYWFSG